MSSTTSFSLNILTALIGSPTYFGFLNLTVLTSPLFLTSKHGMIRGYNIAIYLQNFPEVECPTDDFFLDEIEHQKYYRNLLRRQTFH